MRGRIYVALEDLAVDGNGDTKQCFWEAMNKGSEERLVYKQVVSVLSFTHLMAPAAVLGPNHCPTSLPSSFPASAMR